MSITATLLRRFSNPSVLKSGCCRRCIRCYGFLIGPPDPVSNIRPVKSEQPGSNDHEAEVQLVELRNKMHTLNHTFWKEQNTKYEKEKQLFITQELQRKGESETSGARLSAEEMARFYEHFLNKSYNKQFEYFKKWHMMNIKYILLSVKVNTVQLLRYRKERFTELNFHGLHPMKFFTAKLSRCLTFKPLKQCRYMKLNNIHGKTFAVLLKTMKNTEV